MGYPKKVTFIHPNGPRVQTFASFAMNNGTDRRGARRILDWWQERRYIIRRPDGSFQVIRKMAYRDPATMAMLRDEGYQAPALKMRGAHPDRIIVDEAVDFNA